MSSGSHPKGYGLFLPGLLLSAALVMWFGFQTTQLIEERKRLTEVSASQEELHGKALKLRSQVKALAEGTLQLAQAGNANAAEIVGALKARGIELKSE